MFELIVVIIFFWLLIRAVGFACRLTWGMAKVAAGILMVLALPLLLVCLLFAGGILLLLPLGMIAMAAGITKACIRI
ncbi:MAG: hypothetical protein E7458_04630 [Ruminococcaceae bacterium]|nr:hypothetical protein [Oscillospiraceae bacterium]